MRRRINGIGGARAESFGNSHVVLRNVSRWRIMQPSRQLYEFGPFRIDQRERLLRRGQDVVALPPKAVDLLLVLVEQHGEAVAKDELLRRVWPGTFVEEGSLAQNISLIRKALGDCPESRFVETVPRRGYRFVAAVERRSDEARPPQSIAV